MKSSDDIRVLRPQRYVGVTPRCGYRGIEVTYDRLEILEALRDADGYFNAVVIMDEEFAAWLEKVGLAVRSNRGSHSRTSKLTQVLVARFYDALEASKKQKPLDPRGWRKQNGVRE